jgi:hypothetical protein
MEVTVMQTVRRLGAGLLWIVASLLGLVAVVLCLTIILLPLGIPLLLLTGRLFRVAMRLWAPRAVSHPADELGKKTRKSARKAGKSMPAPSLEEAAETARKGLRRRTRQTRKRLSS